MAAFDDTFDDTSDEAFFGALASAAEAPPVRYGAGDPASAIGAVAQGAAAVVGAITDAVQTGVAQQAQINIMALNNVEKLQWGLTGLKRLFRERADFKKRLNDAIKWMNNPANKRTWMNSAANRAVVKPNTGGLCDTMFEGVPFSEFDNVLQGKPNPGGHGITGPHCRCPYEKCAYKLSEHVKYDSTRIIGADATKRLASIDWGLPNPARIPHAPINGGFAGTVGVGNVNAWRGDTITAWSYLISLEGLREILFTVDPSQAPVWRSEPLLDPTTIKMLFASPEAREPGWTADPEAAQGLVPAHVGAATISQMLTFYGMGVLPAAATVDLWALGFSRAERSRYIAGPTIGQVAQVNKAMWDQGGAAAMLGGRSSSPASFGGISASFDEVSARFGGVSASFGGVSAGPPAPTDLRTTLKNLVVTGQISQVPQAPPSAVPGATAAVAPVRSSEEQAQVARAEAQTGAPPLWRRPAVQIAAGVTASAAVLGVVALIFSGGRKPT